MKPTIELARAAGGIQHRLRAIQLPISLVHLRPIAEALDGHGVLTDASSAGLAIYASAPLGGGNIPTSSPPSSSTSSPPEQHQRRPPSR